MKKLTQRQQEMVSNYNWSNCDDLLECYKSVSNAKYQAQANILQEMKNNKGYDYRICGHNCTTFSCAYRYKKDNKEYLVYYTAYNRYEFCMDMGE